MPHDSRLQRTSRYSEHFCVTVEFSHAVCLLFVSFLSHDQFVASTLSLNVFVSQSFYDLISTMICLEIFCLSIRFRYFYFADRNRDSLTFLFFVGCFSFRTRCSYRRAGTVWSNRVTLCSRVRSHQCRKGTPRSRRQIVEK